MNELEVLGPKGLPITGNLLSFRKNPLEFLQRAAREYGDIVHLRFGPRHLYLINNPDYIKDILVTKQAHFRKGKGLQVAKAVVGEGILTSEGEHHMRQRRLMQPSFRQNHIKLYADTMVNYGEAMIGQWQNGEERIITKDMMELTLAIITKTMFGTDVKEDADDIGHAIEVGLKYVSRRASSFIDIPQNIPTRSNLEFKEAAQTLDRVIYSIIEERRKSKEPPRDDLLSMLLAARDEEDNTGMTDKQVRDEVMTIFVAGHETTANTLSWTLYLLSQNPKAEEKLWKEIDRVLRGRRVTFEDLPELKYAENIIWEALRLYPAAWAINREAIDEVEIGGYTFKPGETLMMSQYVMHRRPEYFERPDEFHPERFEGNLLKEIPQFAFFPFGGGPRVCIGNHFAIMEATLILVTIAQKFRMRLVVGHHPVEPEPVVTLRPKNGLRMIVEER